MLLLAFAFTAHAAGPDDEYLSIYYLIQQGDNAASAGNKVEAAKCYTDAQTGLQRLKTAYPTWQNNVVEYRLKYLARKLAELNVAPPPKPTPADRTAAPPTTAPAGAALDEAVQQQLAVLQAQVQQLLANNDSLQAKLREALSVRPAAADPVELARGEALLHLLQVAFSGAL